MKPIIKVINDEEGWVWERFDLWRQVLVLSVAGCVKPVDELMKVWRVNAEVRINVKPKMVVN